MNKRTVEKCWNEIALFWEGEEPSWDEKVLWAEFDTYGKHKELFSTTDGYWTDKTSDVFGCMKIAKKWKVRHINTWLNDLTNGEYYKETGREGLLGCKPQWTGWHEIPPQYGAEVRRGVNKFRPVYDKPWFGMCGSGCPVIRIINRCLKAMHEGL